MIFVDTKASHRSADELGEDSLATDQLESDFTSMDCIHVYIY